MKTKLFILLVLLSSCNTIFAQADYGYYYYSDKKKPLYVNCLCFYIRGSDVDLNLILADSLKNGYSLSKLNDGCAELLFNDTLSMAEYQSKLDFISNTYNVSVNSCFRNEEFERIYISECFYVKLKNLTDTIILRNFSERNNCEIVSQDKYMPLWFTLKKDVDSKQNSISFANLFYESGLFAASEPDLLVEGLLSNDTYYNNQWGLKNTGQYANSISGIDINIEPAWNITKGQNIMVAVIDHGIDLTHPDLVENIYPLSYDTEGDSMPSWVYYIHGTPCAGIIGAVQNNNAGISGVAPECKLMSISNKFYGYLHNKKLANGINWGYKNGADVISCSWRANPSQYLDDAIDSAATRGRGYKGCIIIYSSGNDDSNTVSYPASLSQTIAVGAICPDGKRKMQDTTYLFDWGSNYGESLSVVAPGVFIPTTDLQGFSGYTISDYTQDFDGTSAAAPHVSGVAALILSVNPDLTGQQVRDIIEKTAQKVGNYNYTYHHNYYNGTWNIEMGYGLIDAYEAVRIARCVNASNTLLRNYIDEDLILIDTTFGYGTITIDSGATLTVKSVLRMDENSQIIVKKGGVLVVEGGIITSACDGLWQGILIEEDATQSVLNAGKVILSKACIENSVCAISNTMNNYNRAKCVIEANKSVFRNNITDIVITQSGNYIWSNANNSFFRDCTFIWDSTMNVTGIPFLSHIYISQIGLYITFSGCNFINEKFPATILTHGILTYNSGIKVLKSDNNDASLFSNFTYGIRMEGGVGLRETFIKNCVFRDNYCGIFTNNTDDLTLMNNRFYLVARLGFVSNVPISVLQPVSPQSIGIAVENTYRTRIEDNDFYGVSNPGALNTVGLLMKNNPYYLYTIERNYFRTLSYGSQAIGSNLNPDNPTYSGVLYGCNTFEGCVRGISIAEDSTNTSNNGIKPVQDRLNYYIYNVVDVENTTNTPVVFYFDNTNNTTLPTISGLVGLQDTVYSSDFCATNPYGLTSESVLLTQQKTLNSLDVTSDKDIVVLDNEDDEELLSLLENGNAQEKIAARGLLYFRGVKTDYHPYIVTSMTDDTVQNKSVKIFKSDIDEGNTILIAPNPARNEVNISSEEMMTKIELINSQGNIVYSKDLSDNSVQIDLSSFSKGNYLVKIALNNRVETKKLIVE